MNIAEIRSGLLQEKTRLTAELRQVETALQALTGKTSPTPAPNPTKGKKAGKTRLRAPFGALEEAIKAAVKAKPGLNNAEIRAALKAKAYAYAVNPSLISKTLVKLKKSGAVAAKVTEEKGYEYSPT